MIPQDFNAFIMLLVFGGGIVMAVIIFIVAGFSIYKIFEEQIVVYPKQKHDKQTDSEVHETKTEEASVTVEPRTLKFLSIPNISPHYINKTQVVDLYQDNFRRPTLENLVSEVTGEKNSEIQGNIPQLAEAHLGGKDIRKLTSTLKMPDISTGNMFLEYQREMIKNNQVSLGLEEIDIELTELQNFEDELMAFEKRFGIKLESTTINHYRIMLKEKAAAKTISKLENPLSWVLVEGRFKISKEGESYKCTFWHPINEYLSQEVEYVTITTLIPIKDLETSISENYAQSLGTAIPLRVYGRVWQPVDRKDKVWEFKIIPMCIY